MTNRKTKKLWPTRRVYEEVRALSIMPACEDSVQASLCRRRIRDTGQEFVGLLGLGKITSVERLADLTLEPLLKSLRETWRRGASRDLPEKLADASHPRIFIIPFDNATGALLAGQIVNNVALSSLFACGYSVVEPRVCLRCHEDFNKTLSSKSVHTPLKSGKCSQCHNPHASAYADQLLEPQRQLCVQCLKGK